MKSGNFKWTREPEAFKNDNGKMEIITKPNTDLWQRTYYHFQNDNAPVCHIHDYYGRNIIDFRYGHLVKDNLCIMRVFCDNCEHAHAVLPDIIIPYSSYGLFFVLRVLAEFFAHLHTVEQICERYNISENQLRKWISLWKLHKEQWLGLLNDSETSDLALLKRLCSKDKFSSFSQEFTLHMSHTFLQSHRNPILKRPANARYHQHAFSPDYDIW